MIKAIKTRALDILNNVELEDFSTAHDVSGWMERMRGFRVGLSFGFMPKSKGTQFQLVTFRPDTSLPTDTIHGKVLTMQIPVDVEKFVGSVTGMFIAQGTSGKGFCCYIIHKGRAVKKIFV